MMYAWMILVGIACRSEESIKSYNVNPEVTITSHSEGSALSEGFEETFRAQASDPNHETAELLVSWFYGERRSMILFQRKRVGLCSITPVVGQTHFVRKCDPLVR